MQKAEGMSRCKSFKIWLILEPILGPFARSPPHPEEILTMISLNFRSTGVILGHGTNAARVIFLILRGLGSTGVILGYDTNAARDPACYSAPPACCLKMWTFSKFQNLGSKSQKCQNLKISKIMFFVFLGGFGKIFFDHFFDRNFLFDLF